MNPDPENILEVKTVQTTRFKKLIESLKENITDASFEFRPGNSQNEDDAQKGFILCSAMDGSQTVLVHMKLDGKRFEQYYCKKKMIVGINMPNLAKLIKMMTSNDILTLFISENDTNGLGIIFENAEKPNKTRFRLNLIDLNHEIIDIPKQPFSNMIIMPSDDFQKICRDMNTISDKIEIKNVNNQLYFSCKSDFVDQETVLNEHSGLTFQIDQEKDEVIQGYYNLKHLVQFTKCTDLSTTVTLYMKNDFPIILDYTFSLGSVKLALGPCVNN